MKSGDRIFLALLGLLLCTCAPAFARANDLVGAAVAAGGVAVLFSLLLLGLRSFRTKLWYGEAIREAERFHGRRLTSEERERFDRAYWS